MTQSIDNIMHLKFHIVWFSGLRSLKSNNKKNPRKLIEYLIPCSLEKNDIGKGLFNSCFVFEHILYFLQTVILSESWYSPMLREQRTNLIGRDSVTSCPSIVKLGLFVSAKKMNCVLYLTCYISYECMFVSFMTSLKRVSFLFGSQTKFKIIPHSQTKTTERFI